LRCFRNWQKLLLSLMRSPKRMKAKGIMHMAKLRKPSNEQAHATPKRSYLFNEVSTVFLGKLSTRDVALLPHITSDATLWRHRGCRRSRVHTPRSLRPFDSHIHYLHRPCRERQNCTKQAPRTSRCCHSACCKHFVRINKIAAVKSVDGLSKQWRRKVRYLIKDMNSNRNPMPKGKADITGTAQ
jgi:hypothetical protein